jgi:hypothetical protein
MIQIVIFSFNRAMQLDYLLKSILLRFKSPKFKIAIIYHTTGYHKKGYEKLRAKYYDNKDISFHERKRQIFGLKSYYPTFHNKINFKLFIKNSIIFNRKSDNFKRLLESLLKKTTCDYVMFNTDDGYFFEDVNISPKILNLITSNPLQTSFRLYVGENLDEHPDFINNIDNEYYEWNYYENSKITHWTYPFAVDGTIYHTKSILSIIRRIYYHNPIDLEGNGVSYVRKNKLLSLGLGPIKSKLVCTKLNRVSTTSFNPTIHINVDYLNQKFIEGYELELEMPTTITNANIVPSKVYLIKETERELIYSIDEKGKKIQSALGVEGTKFQIE